MESFRHLIETGLKGFDEAKERSILIVESIRKTHGGEILYIPMMKSSTTQARNNEIFSKFTGTNYKALAHEYGLSEQQIYRVIESERNKRQSDLFS